MLKIIFDSAPDNVKTLVNLIRKDIKGTAFEGKVYIVGGAIRDMFMNRAPSDVNLVVEMVNGGIVFAEWLCKKHKSFVTMTNPLFERHIGRSTFVLGRVPELKNTLITCEQTCKRRPNEDGLTAAQLYGTITEDANTRDFTINSIYYNISSDKVFDKTGSGVFDIVNKIIRTHMKPVYVMDADPIRIMRAIRFAGMLDMKIDKNTWLAMTAKAPLIDLCENDDIRYELNKMLLIDKPSVSMERLYGCGVMRRILPDVFALKDECESFVNNVSALKHTMRVLDETFPYLENRLAALFHDIGKTVVKGAKQDAMSAEAAAYDMSELGYGTELSKKVSMIIKNHRYFSAYNPSVSPPVKKVKRFLATCGKDYPSVLDLMNAENICSEIEKKPSQVLEILKTIEKIEQEKEESDLHIPINGNDLMEVLGIKKGPQIGYLLAVCNKAFKENKSITKEELIEIAKAEIKALTT